MSHLTLRTKDLTFERSKVRSGGVHNFEGFTRSPTAADKALLYKGSPSTSHVFGHATALNNKTKDSQKIWFDQIQECNPDSMNEKILIDYKINDYEKVFQIKSELIIGIKSS